MKTQRTLTGEKIKIMPENKKPIPELPKSRFDHKLLGYIIAPKKIQDIYSNKVSFVHVHSVVDNDVKDKLMQKYDLLSKNKNKLDFWMQKDQEKLLDKLKQKSKYNKLSLQKELIDAEIYGTPSGPTYELYGAIFNHLNDETLERKRELFFSTIKMSIPRIFEPNDKTVRMAYIFGNMIGFARSNNILDLDSAKHLIYEIELNLYNYFRAIDPNLRMNTPAWAERTKAWTGIRQRAIRN